MKRKPKVVERRKARRSARIRPQDQPRRKKWLAVGVGLVIAVVVSYSLELDVLLRLGSGEVTGWLRRLDRSSRRLSYRGANWPVVAVVTEGREPSHYFHSFLPGVYRRIYEAMRAHENAVVTGPAPAHVRSERPARSVITRAAPVYPQLVYGRIRYAGLVRKSVYAFEELPSPP